MKWRVARCLARALLEAPRYFLGQDLTLYMCLDSGPHDEHMEAKGPKNVLIVDDEPAVASAMRQILEHVGYRVTCILDGNLALRRIAQEPFDVIITDIFMPDVDGAELIRIARQQGSQARIIAVSGGGTYMTSPEALGLVGKIGAAAVVQKPFSAADLIAAVNGDSA